MTEPAQAAERLAERFAETFRHWDIRIPAEHVANRTRGKIVARGWAIWYLFGRDEQGEHLDYYASHRMMIADEHIRLRELGEIEELPILPPFGPAISDDPQVNARRKAEHDAECREIAAILRAKGFVIEGDEPGAVQMNMLIRSGDLDIDAERRAHRQGDQSADGPTSPSSPNQ